MGNRHGSYSEDSVKSARAGDVMDDSMKKRLSKVDSDMKKNERRMRTAFMKATGVSSECSCKECTTLNEKEWILWNEFLRRKEETATRELKEYHEERISMRDHYELSKTEQLEKQMSEAKERIIEEKLPLSMISYARQMFETRIQHDFMCRCDDLKKKYEEKSASRERDEWNKFYSDIKELRETSHEDAVTEDAVDEHTLGAFPVPSAPSKTLKDIMTAYYNPSVPSHVIEENFCL